MIPAAHGLPLDAAKGWVSHQGAGQPVRGWEAQVIVQALPRASAGAPAVLSPAGNHRRIDHPIGAAFGGSLLLGSIALLDRGLALWALRSLVRR